MGTAVIAAAAGLAGVLLQTLITLTTDHRTRTQHHRHALTEVLHAVLQAAVRHRNRQYLKHRAREHGETDTPEARRDRYDARSDLTTALDTIHLTTANPHLIAAAQHVFDTAIALGDATTSDEIRDTGLRARQAHTALRDLANHLIHP